MVIPPGWSQCWGTDPTGVAHVHYLPKCIQSLHPNGSGGLTTSKEDGGVCSATWQGHVKSPGHDGGNCLAVQGWISPWMFVKLPHSLGKTTSLPHGMGKGLVVFWSPTGFFSPHRLVTCAPDGPATSPTLDNPCTNNNHVAVTWGRNAVAPGHGFQQAVTPQEERFPAESSLRRTGQECPQAVGAPSSAGSAAPPAAGGAEVGTTPPSVAEAPPSPSAG